VTPRLGLFGGTFDPPHLGHLALAESARDQLGLARVFFVPAGAPPHKRAGGVTPARHRLAMTRLAVRANPAFTVLDVETRRAGPSYTVDTLRALVAARPRAAWYLLLGEDSFDALASWREPDVLRSLATLAVAPRPGARRRRGRRAACVWLDAPLLALSSSGLRRRLAAGDSARYLVPDAVARYIARHHLYRRSR